MAKVGSLDASLTLESAQFIASMKKASAQAVSSLTAMEKHAGVAAGAIKGLAGAFVVAAFQTRIREAFDYADAIEDISAKTGFSKKTIQEFGYAAQLSGSSVESARAGLEKFSKLLGEASNRNQSAIKSLREIGVTSLNNDEALRQAADGIAKLSNRSAQAAQTTDKFGKKAMDLTVTLAGGSKGLDEFGRKAAELGIVLGDDLISNAGQVNDKLDTMKMITDARWASMIVKNADALVGLADAFTQLTGALTQFTASNPQAVLAVIGALGGGMVGGLPGAAAGAGLGYFGGTVVKGMSDDANMDVGFRLKKMREARAAFHDAQSGASDLASYGPVGTTTSRPNLKGAHAEFGRQVGKLQEALKLRDAGKVKPPAANDNGGTIPGLTSTSSGPNAFELDAQWQSDLGRANSAYLQARQALTSSVIEQAAYEREMLSLETAEHKRQIAADGPAGSKKYSQAQVEQLQLLEDKISFARADLINQKENEELARQTLARQQGYGDIARDLLQSELGSARTAAKRREIGMRLVDLQYQQERLALDAVVASKTATEAEKQIAQARLGILGKLKSNAQADVQRQSLGPGAAYMDGFPKTAEEMNEALESVKVDGLQSLEDGLTGVMTGAKSLGDVFSDMADQIIADLMRIAIRQAIIKPLGDALFGVSGGGAGGASAGLFGGLFKGLFGKRANGGLTRPGSYLMGERGPEIVEVGATSNVIPNHRLGALRDARSAMTFIIDARGSTDPAAVDAAARRAITEAMPVNAQIASDLTFKRASRPRM